MKRKCEVDDKNEEEDTTGRNRASKRRPDAKPDDAVSDDDVETGLSANEGNRKVKAVKQKKIFYLKSKNN